MLLMGCLAFLPFMIAICHYRRVLDAKLLMCLVSKTKTDVTTTADNCRGVVAAVFAEPAYTFPCQGAA